MIPNISNETQATGALKNNFDILRKKARIAEAWHIELASAELISEQISYLILASGQFKNEDSAKNFTKNDTNSSLIQRMVNSIFLTNFLNWTERLYKTYTHLTDYVDYIDEYQMYEDKITEYINQNVTAPAREISCSLKQFALSNQTIGFCVGSCLSGKVEEKTLENLLNALKPR